MKFNPSKMSMSELNNRALVLAKIQIAIWSVILIGSALLLVAPQAKADCDEIYLKVGTGYKTHETEYIESNDGLRIDIESSPYSARIESGVECGNLTWGVAHHSQWLTGFPFNNQKELNKTELFIDYKFSWGI